MGIISKRIKVLYDEAKLYAETSLELFKLKAIDKVGNIVSSIILIVATVFIGLILFLFLNIALGLYLGRLFGEYYLGFLAVCGFYFIIMLFLILFGKRLIKNSLYNTIISKFL